LTTPKLPSSYFELETHGIGLKLMHNMGYIGGGLSKNGQGIANPIHLVMRPTKSKLGFVGTSFPLASCLDISVIQTQFVPSEESNTSDDSFSIELQ